MKPTFIILLVIGSSKLKFCFEGYYSTFNVLHCMVFLRTCIWYIFVQKLFLLSFLLSAKYSLIFPPLPFHVRIYFIMLWCSVVMLFHRSVQMFVEQRPDTRKSEVSKLNKQQSTHPSTLTSTCHYYYSSQGAVKSSCVVSHDGWKTLTTNY